MATPEGDRLLASRPLDLASLPELHCHVVGGLVDDFSVYLVHVAS